jgi:hypothetical protein
MQQTAVKERRNLLAVFTVAAAAAVFACGCGNQYRPVVTATNPVGPAGQPSGQYAIAISNPGPDPANAATCQFLPGLLTFVDVSGDTVLSTPNILQLPTLSPALPSPCGAPTPVNPNMFALNAAGATTTSGSTTVSTSGYVVNPQGSFNEFPLGNPTTLLTQDVVQTALSEGANPISMSAISVGTAGETVFVTQAGTLPSVGASIAALSVSPTPSLLQPINLPPGQIPGYVVGADGTQRVYAISQDASGNGEVSSIEGTQLATSATIPVGTNPVYGVMTPDTRRAFILNQGSNNISVINVVNNAPDTGVQVPNSSVGTIPLAVGTNPVWADLSTINSQLAVLSKGNGTTPGTLTIINIPLCNIASPTGNPNCNLNNPTDASNFGTVLGTVSVGVNPSMVSVLSDGTQAYVVNNSDPVHCAATEGSVSVVSLSSFTVTATICGITTALASDPNANPTLVHGHPATVASTAGKPTGKVYVTSPDSEDLTIIRTDNNTVETHITLQGVGIRVLTTQR